MNTSVSLNVEGDENPTVMFYVDRDRQMVSVRFAPVVSNLAIFGTPEAVGKFLHDAWYAFQDARLATANPDGLDGIFG